MNQIAVGVQERKGLSHSIETAVIVLLVIATIPLTLVAMIWFLAAYTWRDSLRALRQPPNRREDLQPAAGEGQLPATAAGERGRPGAPLQRSPC